jgi:hypothetical protein
MLIMSKKGGILSKKGNFVVHPQTSPVFTGKILLLYLHVF